MTPDEKVVALFQKEAGRIYGYLIKCGASPEDAEDCVQDAFLAAARRWDQLQNPLAYAYKVARHQLIYRWKLPGREVPTDRHEDVADTAGDPIRPADPATGESGRAKGTGSHAPGRANEAITLRYLHGFSLCETAEIMGVSTGAVKRYTYEGLSILRAILEDENGEGESR